VAGSAGALALWCGMRRSGASLLCCSAAAAVAWYTSPRTTWTVPLAVELEAAELLAVGDVAEVDGKAVSEAPNAEVRQALIRPMREWFCAAYLRFGRLEDTPADRRTVHRWLADEMKAGNVRNKDAMDWIPAIIECMFIPTAGEVYATMVAKSGTAHVLRSMYRSGRE